MKVTFRGWKRLVHEHEVTVTPVALKGRWYRPVERRKSLVWSDAMTVFGKVNDLALTGAFLAKFDFTEAELKSWLTRFLIARPEDALQLIAAAQADAIRHLSQQSKSK